MNEDLQTVPPTTIEDDDERFIRWSRNGIIAFAILFVVGVVGIGFWLYFDYRSLTNELDDGLSAFEGNELVAAERALDVAKSTCVSYDTGPIGSQARFEVTDVELTGGMVLHRAQQVPNFTAKVQAYGVFGRTQMITVWTEDDGVHRDCGSPD
jgi:hypothetical protein